MSHSDFILFPAIDLRRGQVVRLIQGDPGQQTTYSADPAETAERWLQAGARWLHVVNLDGAFGERDAANHQALAAILETARRYDARVQFGGGLREAGSLAAALELGVGRAVLGTAAVENPGLLERAVRRYGPERIAAGLDARDGLVQVRGWAEGTAISAASLARRLAKAGLRWLIFTDVARDGLRRGLNLPATVELAQSSGLQVVASGGVASLDDVRQARDAGLAGAIAGKALYEGQIDLAEWEF